MKYSVVIPAYNEELGIQSAIIETARVFRALGESFEILAVDDGSTDETKVRVRSLIQEFPELILVEQFKNQGKGAAVSRGVAESKGEYVLFLDADLATHPSEFSKFIEPLSRADIVIGSRHAHGARIEVAQPLSRRLAGQIFRTMVNNLLDTEFMDTQCGFKAFRKSSTYLFKNLVAKGWAFDVELLAQAKHQGLRVEEVPIVWRDRRESRVKLSHTFRIFREILSIRHRLLDDASGASDTKLET